MSGEVSGCRWWQLQRCNTATALPRWLAGWLVGWLVGWCGVLACLAPSPTPLHSTPLTMTMTIHPSIDRSKSSSTFVRSTVRSCVPCSFVRAFHCSSIVRAFHCSVTVYYCLFVVDCAAARCCFLSVLPPSTLPLFFVAPAVASDLSHYVRTLFVCGFLVRLFCDVWEVGFLTEYAQCLLLHVL